VIDHIVIAIHGILTRATDPSWPDHLRAWAVREYPAAIVLPSSYWAWPCAPLNVWALNHYRARVLLADLLPLLEIRGGAPISIVAHSNGADIALKLARLLWARRVPLRSLILTNAACPSAAAPIAARIATGHLRSAIAVCSRRDTLLRSALVWPWGRLGYTGWTGPGSGTLHTYRRGIRNYWSTVGHGALWSPPQREHTFALLANWLAL
jgi:pimeloyl-ACP methyl ester carboxylesterase